jgi:hypothetical protein
MYRLLMVVFWLTGIALYVFGVLFGLQMWDLPGLIAFAVVPPLELLLPFIVWFTTGLFPVLLFGLWAVQMVVFGLMAASKGSDEVEL